MEERMVKIFNIKSPNESFMLLVRSVSGVQYMQINT